MLSRYIYCMQCSIIASLLRYYCSIVEVILQYCCNIIAALLRYYCSIIEVLLQYCWNIIADYRSRMLGFYQGIKQLPVKIRLFAPSLWLYNPFAMFPPYQLPRLGGHLRDVKTQPKFVLWKCMNRILFNLFLITMLIWLGRLIFHSFFW